MSSIFLLSIQLKFTFKKDGEKVEGVDPERIPGININMNTNDNDPANTARFDNERITTNERIKEIEMQLNADKTKLQNVIASQASKIQEITQLAMTTYTILNSLASKKYRDPDFYFENK